ncbi:hypothetical protein [Thermogemmatispora sp.]|uniref:hypothetical protein n=1 Tax=Thermogemmatispora sp. TaxID=1968838 RepID=UPI0035E42C4C
MGPTAAVTSSPTTQTAGGPFKVTAVDMAVKPASIANLPCGTTLTVTYTATFHVAPGSSGGTIQFSYTINNGRGERAASLYFQPGQTLGTFSFTWNGALPVDHTAPGAGGVQVSSPNQVTSSLLAPTGQCSPTAFRVTGVTISVSPASIAGLRCGTFLTEKYTATFHVAPGSLGGVVRFGYTVNNGRSGGDDTQTLTFAPGVTTMTYTFTWSGPLPADHTFPEPGGVAVSSPNVLQSPLVGPTGSCS